jgi:hypothetical protein
MTMNEELRDIERDLEGQKLTEAQKKAVRNLMRLPEEHPVATFREWAKIIIPALAFAAAAAAAMGAWRNLKVAEARMMLDQRPWVSLDNFSLEDVVFDTSGLSWSLRFQIKNSGLTPAQHVAVGIESVPNGTPFSPEGLKDKACADAEASMGALSIFPRDQFPWGMGASIRTEAVDKFRSTFNNEPTAKIAPFTIVCVAYRSTLDEKFHHTPYAVTLDVDGLTATTENTPQKKLTGTARGLPFDRIGSVD